MLSSLAGFLEFLKGLAAKQRLGAAFGSYGWAGGAVKNIEGILQSAGIELALPGVSVKYAPDTDETKRCYEFGKDFAGKILKSLTPPPLAE
jgi:flavorubredoxin